MLLHSLRGALRRFRKDNSGSVMVETVICLPLLFFALAATFEFFDVHRYKSAREKATYTLADMLSRETASVSDVYMDNAMSLFDSVTNDSGINQIRVSVIQYDLDTDEYFVWWSEVRGTGSYSALTDADVRNAHDKLPIMTDGDQVILVESKSEYIPLFKNVGLGPSVPISTRMFTSIRFAAQLCMDWQHCGDGDST